jgi:hypothetical protein
MTMTHTCIKPGCGIRYEDEDPEPYYCASCNEQRKILAKEIDAKATAIPKRPAMSALAEYDASPKVRGFVITKL